MVPHALRGTPARCPGGGRRVHLRTVRTQPEPRPQLNIVHKPTQNETNCGHLEQVATRRDITVYKPV